MHPTQRPVDDDVLSRTELTEATQNEVNHFKAGNTYPMSHLKTRPILAALCAFGRAGMRYSNANRFETAEGDVISFGDTSEAALKNHVRPFG